MARTRSATYEDQRGLILAQAAALFARQGYAGTSMNQVAAACGVSKPALYHYVSDKHELLALICQDHIARLQALVAAVAAQAQAEGLDARAHLQRLILRFVLAYADARHEHRVLTEDLRHLAPDQHASVVEGQRAVVAAFAELVARLRPGATGETWARPLTMLLFGMINWMFTWLRAEGPLRHADMAPLVAELFLGGLATLDLSRPLPAAPALAIPSPSTAPADLIPLTTGDRP